MKQLAKALMKSKSFKERQEQLNESLSYLSFWYPDLYLQLFREMKKRELESNDPNKITKWLTSSTSNSYVKLYESLMMVKSNNLLAKEEYLKSLKHMLSHTIVNGTNIEEAMKICSLIEKSSHLQTINEHLADLILQVKQLNVNRRNTHVKRQAENMRRLHYQTNSMKIENVPNLQPSAPIWPTLLQPTILNPTHGRPYFNLECSGYDHLEMYATVTSYPTFDLAHSFSNLTILNQEMDGSIAKWLRYLKLHKYQWFFNELSYLEIELIDEDNIEGFIAKVNKNSITKGAQKKICISTKALRDRKQKFQDLLMTLDLEVTPNELCEYITYMRDILNYPLPNKNCIVGDELQQDIVLIMEKFFNQILEKLCATKYLVANSLLGTSINKYLECSMLITGNQIFMRHQVEKTLFLTEKLKLRVHRMPKNFN